MRPFADVPRLAQAAGFLMILTLTTCTGTSEPEMTALRGSYSGTTRLVPPRAGGSLDRCNANTSDEEHPGFTFSFLDDFTGEFEVLGPVTLVGSGCLHEQRGRFAQGEMTIRIAGGNVLMTEFHGSFRGTIAPAGVGRAEHHVVGGTGRFAQAEGAFVCEFRFRSGGSTSEVEGTCHGDISL